MSKLSKGIAMNANRMAWFDSARFGMFIHWGLYALLGRGEWVMNREMIPLPEYEKLAGEFTAKHFDPRKWADTAAKAGMKYIVLTTKHHEGFCLWNSQICKFNATHSAARRDLVAEYVEAVRAAGLKVGLYYSLGDWHNPDWALGWKGDLAARERFMQYTHALVRELVTQYGEIDILWYDLPQCYSPGEWRAVDLNAMVRRFQPQIIINNRAMTTEDFATSEGHVAAASAGRIWEACMTLNNHWGYCPFDHDYKSPRAVLMNLLNAAHNAGNLLLNVGPNAEGRIPVESERILAAVGRWLGKYGESVYGSERHPMRWNMWGPTTRKGSAIYLHLETYCGDTLVVACLDNQIKKATFLTNGKVLNVKKEGERHLITGLPKKEPEELVNVVKLELDSPPRQDFSHAIGTADFFPDFPK